MTLFFFFFQAEDGIRDTSVTGVQTCALPICKGSIEITVLFPAGSSADVTARLLAEGIAKQLAADVIVVNRPGEIGRARVGKECRCRRSTYDEKKRKRNSSV